jgi:MinD-like ATPase involved in chromosome partitioning or flagellar assembly
VSLVFISYRHSDSTFVNQLAEDLEKANYDIWLDTGRITGRAPFWTEIQAAIASCSHFIFVISPESIAPNSQALLELFQAASRDPLPTIVPVLAKETDLDTLPIVINKGLYQIHDFTGSSFSQAMHRLRLALQPPQSELTVMAIMGTRGGVGKGTFTACGAQILAEANHDVAIIDFDIEGHGSTFDAKRRWPNIGPVRTVFDHIAPHSHGFERHIPVDDDSLWNVTPEYLKKRDLGSIYMIPAARDDDMGTWEVVANVPVPREERLRDITAELLQRIQRKQPEVRFVLIDCGAGKNPIFSAGFANADYGFIVINPDSAFFEAISHIKTEHTHRYPPEVGLRRPRYGIHTVVNFVTSEEDIERVKGLNPIGYIQRNPTMQEYQFSNPIDFDLGFDDVFRDVHYILKRTLFPQVILPDEFEIRLGRWWRLFIEGKLVEQTLRSRKFRLQALGAWLLTILTALTLLFTLAYNIYHRIDFNTYQIDTSSILLSLAAFVLTVYFYLWWHIKRSRLLKRIGKLGSKVGPDHIEFLEKLKQTDRGLFQYLNKLVQKEQLKVRQQRSGYNSTNS